jgi:hypothetical protein
MQHFAGKSSGCGTLDIKAAEDGAACSIICAFTSRLFMT